MVSGRTQNFANWINARGRRAVSAKYDESRTSDGLLDKLFNVSDLVRNAYQKAYIEFVAMADAYNPRENNRDSPRYARPWALSVPQSNTVTRMLEDPAIPVAF